MVGQSSTNSGRTTAAQWMRVAFHDFITADVKSGTGGIDASIGFETSREENKGSAFNDSFTFWRPFVNEYVPMADLVALGTVMSVGLCGGNHIPYRPGRIDSTHADPTTGVPEPGTDLKETLSQFERAGFDQADSIALTACGHTMGSVHHGGFPEVSPESAVTPNNTNGGVNFDTTRGSFDSLVVHEYIDGTGQMGGPLVTSFNESSRSDLRLFESDGNSTMRDLYERGERFQDVCADVMGRMINTVPAAAKLTTPITPIALKPINFTWDFDSNDRLILSGKIRVLGAIRTILPPLNIELGGQTIQIMPEREEGTTVYGSTGIRGGRVQGVTRYYPISIPGRDLTNITSFAVSADGFDKHTFPISYGPFIVPSLSTSDGETVRFAVAVPQGHSRALPEGLVVSITAPVPQPLTLGPKLATGTGEWSSETTSQDGFTVYTGTYRVGQRVTGAISLTLLNGNQVQDTLLVGAGIAGW
ncbi:hypothetical protein JX266_012656 [Neoarthrinium moseri]|nr:hypothetical protein JX266_012656 [Neoarthrinium moseri]